MNLTRLVGLSGFGFGTQLIMDGEKIIKHQNNNKQILVVYVVLLWMEYCFLSTLTDVVVNYSNTNRNVNYSNSVECRGAKSRVRNWFNRFISFRE